MIGTMHTQITNEAPPTFLLDVDFKAKVKKELEEDGWNTNGYFAISNLTKDIYGITLQDGTYYPPTNRYRGHIAVQRADGAFFQCRIVEEAEEIENVVNEAVLLEDYANARETLKEFLNCECGIEGKTCKKHENMPIATMADLQE